LLFSAISVELHAEKEKNINGKIIDSLLFLAGRSLEELVLAEVEIRLNVRSANTIPQCKVLAIVEVESRVVDRMMRSTVEPASCSHALASNFLEIFE
jgi:hypothetical protein